MPANTDQRIIQMRFENREFERNIAKSKKSVEELKQAMDFEKTSSGLKKFADGMNALDFAKLSDNIQRLTDKFTGLGNMAELVVSQVRRKIESLAARVTSFVDSMTTVQVSAGMDKYEMLNKSVQTIKAATGRDEKDVYDVLQRLNQYTDQTSYNFSDMAQNIGKFTSVGIKLEDAERQMEGIANWAARSGAGINEASRAMYNLSQAMGVGKMTLIDWKSIENAGMATKEFKEQLIASGLAAGTLVKDSKGVIKTAKSLGKQIEVNYQNIGQTFSKGWAKSNVISATLEKYYYDDLYYEKSDSAILQLAEDQQKAFDEMTKSGKKLDLSEWQKLKLMGVLSEETKQKIVDLAVTQGKLTKEVKKDGSVVYKTTDKAGKKVEYTLDNIQDSLKSGWFDEEFGKAATSINELAKSSYEAAQKCLTFTDVLGAWRDQISTGWMTSFKIIFGELSESMEFFSNVCNRVGEGIGELIDLRNEALESWSKSGGRKSLISIILGDYGEETATGAFGFLDLLESLKTTVFDGFKDFMMIFASDEDKAAIANNDKSFGVFLGYKLSDMTKSIQEFLKKIHNFFSEEVQVGGKTVSRLDMIQDIISGISGALSLAIMLGSEAVGFIEKIGGDLKPAIDNILLLLADLGLNIYDTASTAHESGSIATFFTELHTAIQPTILAIGEIVTAFTDLLRSLLGLDEESETNTISSTFSKIGDVIKKVARAINSVAAPVLHFVADIINAFRDLFKGGFDEKSIAEFGEKAKNAFNVMVDTMPESIKKVINFVRTAFSTIKNVFTSGFSAESLGNLKTFFKDSVSKIMNLIPQGVKDKINEIAGKVGGFFSGLWSNITGKLSGIFQSDTGAGKILSAIRGWFSKIWSSITGLFGGKGAASKVGAELSLFEKIGGVFTQFFEKLKGIWDSISGIFHKNSNAGASDANKELTFVQKMLLSYKNFFEGLGDILKKVAGFIGKLFQGLKDFGSQINKAMGIFGEEGTFSEGVSKVLLVLGAGGFIFILAKTIIGAIKIAKTLSKGITNLVSILKDGINWKKVLKGKEEETSKFEDFVGNFLKLAVAVGILTTCLVTIGAMKLENAIQGVIGIALLLASLGLMSMWMKKIYEDFEPKNALSMFVGMYAIATAAGKLVRGLLPLANLNLDQLGNMGIGLAAIITTFVILTKMMEKTDLDKDKAKGYTMIAASVWIMVQALNTLAKLAGKDPDNLIKALISLGVILGMLVGFTWAIKKVDLKDKELTQLIALAGAVAILVFSLIPLTIVPWTGLLKMGIGLMAILGMLVGFTWAIKKVDLNDKHLRSLAALAASVGILVFSLTPLAHISWEGLAKMGAGLLAVLGMLIGFIWAIKKVDLEDKHLRSLVALALSVAILMTAVKTMADIEDPWKLVQALLGIAAILTMLWGFAKLMSKITMSGSGMGQVILLALGLLVMMAPLVILANMNVWKMLKGILGVGLIMAALAGIAFVLSKTKLTDALTGLLLMAGMAGVLLAFAAVMFDLKDIPTDKIWAFVAALGVLTLGIAGAAVIAKVAGIDGVLLLVALIAAVLGVIALMAPIVISSVSNSLAEMAAYLDLMSTMLVSFSSNMNQVDEGGIDKAKSIIDKLGTLFTDILTFKVGAWASHDLTEMVAYLELIAGQLIQVGNRFKQVDIKSIQKVKTVVAILTATFTTETNEALTSGLDAAKALTTLISQLSLSSGQLITVSSRMESVDTKSVWKITAIVLTLIGTFTEENKTALTTGKECATALTEMASQLTLSAGNMIDFSTRMNKVSLLAIPKALLFVEESKLLMKSLEGYGDYQSRISAFSTAMFDLGTGIEIFDGHTKNTGSVENNSALDIIKQLAACANDMDTIAKMKISSLTSNLSGLGGAMILYAKGAKEATGLYDQEGEVDDTYVAGAVEIMQRISTALTENGGFTIPQNMPDEEALGVFGAQLAALAAALVMFEEAGSSLGDGTKQALETLTFFRELKEKLVETDLKTNLSTALDAFQNGSESVQPSTLETFGKNIEQLGKAMGKFAESVTVVDAETNEVKPIDYSKAVEALESLAGLNEKLPTIGGIKDWLDGNQQSLTDFAGELQTLGDGLKLFAMKVTGQSEDGYTGFDSVLVDKGTEESQSMVDKAVEVCGKLIEYEKQLREATGTNWISSLLGETYIDFTTFAGEIATLGQGLADFSMYVTGQSGEGEFKGFDSGFVDKGTEQSQSMVDKAVEVCGKLIEYEKKLREATGTNWISSLLGETYIDFIAFAGEITTLGQGLADFSMYVTGQTGEGEFKGFDSGFVNKGTEESQSMVDKAVEVCGKLVDFRNSLNPDGGWITTIWSGKKPNFIQLGAEIGALGTGLANFSKYVTGQTGEGEYKGFDTGFVEQANKDSKSMVDKAIEISEKLIDAHARLGEQKKKGGWKSVWEGEEPDLGSLGEEVGRLGAGLGEFSQYVNGDKVPEGQKEASKFDAKIVEEALGTVDSITTIMNEVSTKLSKVGGLSAVWSTFTGGRAATLSDVGSQLSGISEGLGKFGDSISGKFENTDDVTNALKAIDGVIGLMIHLSEASNFTYGTEAYQYAAGLNMFLQAFLNGIDENGETDYYSSLEAIMEIMHWINDELNKAPDINIDNLQKFGLLTEALNNLAGIDVNKDRDFENIGMSIATGIANGIIKGTSVVTAAAEQLAIETYNATMKALDAASPSKVFIGVGSYIGLGMAKGIDNTSGEVTDAATGMSEEAIESTKDMIGIISRIMAEGVIDEKPVISPVLDLTNLNAGMAKFKEGLNGYSLNLDLGNSAILAGRYIGDSGEDRETTTTPPDYTGIYERMDTLGRQMLQMEDSIRQMKLVLDTGAVAGGISDRVDELIGEKIWRLNRNNSV